MEVGRHQVECRGPEAKLYLRVLYLEKGGHNGGGKLNKEKSGWQVRVREVAKNHITWAIWSYF